jgi:phosphoserine phosphatase RsbU/P
VPPDEALAHLNDELLSQQLSLCQFVTMIYGILNTRTLELQWARAGHPLPMRLKSSGEAEELELDGALLGVFPGEQFPLQKVQLVRGDSILMYSDGFESAFTDSAGVINDRYRHEFAKLAGADPGARFAAMVQELDKQEGSLHQRDDLTALLLTIRDRSSSSDRD